MKLNLLVSICFLILLYNNNAFGQIGDPAPNFTVTDTKGNSHTLYDYLNNGKKVLLDFFFTTCIPCQYYSPQVNLAYTKYGCNEGDVVFMSIDLNNSTSEVVAYEEEYKIKFPSISGDDGGGNAVINQYNVNSFPRFYLIDSTYKIIDVIDPPTLQVFDFKFGMHGIGAKECSVSTIETNSTQGFNIYPNPATNQVSFNFKNDVDRQSVWDFRVLNNLGQAVSEGEIHNNSIDVSNLTNGFYSIELKGGDKLFVTKMIISKE